MKMLLPFVLAWFSKVNAEQVVWQPDKTWVFAVGVIDFDDPSVKSWSEVGRADVRLVSALEKRGVAQDRILFIKDEQATHAKIVKQFSPFLQRAGSEDTLIFYYAGHGLRDYSNLDRPCTFLTFDTKAEWTVDSILSTVGESFRGSQVIYTADCCHSGSLAAGVERQRGRAAALTSAHVSSGSTGNWTFTNCLVRMFDGSPLMDQNQDGQITWAEAADHIDGEMAFSEEQHAENAVSGGFPADIVMSKATGPAARMVHLIEGESQGTWWKAVVLAEREGQVLVTWPGWGPEHDEWLPLERTRPYRPRTFTVGDAVRAEWHNEWYDARVVKVELGLQLVHYEGFPDTDDEWVSLERLRKRP